MEQLFQRLALRAKSFAKSSLQHPQKRLDALWATPHPTTMIGSVVVGGALGAVGIFGYLATGKASKTALIPAYFGGVLGGVGLVGVMSPGLQTLLQPVAIGVAALGLLGSASGAVQWLRSLAAKEGARAAVKSKAAMAVLCLLYLLSLAL